MTLEPGRWYPNTKATREQMDPEQYHWLKWASGNTSGHTYRKSEIENWGKTGSPFDVAAVAVARERV